MPPLRIEGVERSGSKNGKGDCHLPTTECEEGNRCYGNAATLTITKWGTGFDVENAVATVICLLKGSCRRWAWYDIGTGQRNFKPDEKQQYHCQRAHGLFLFLAIEQMRALERRKTREIALCACYRVFQLVENGGSKVEWASTVCMPMNKRSGTNFHWCCGRSCCSKVALPPVRKSCGIGG